MLTRRKQPTKALLKDVGKAASRIAEDSRSAAGTARSELGGLGAELRDQAAETLTHARLATAARLAGAAETVQPPRKKHRRLRLVIPAIIGGFVAAKVAKLRREQAQVLATEETHPETPTPPSKPATTRDESNGKSRAKQSSTAAQ